MFRFLFGPRSVSSALAIFNRAVADLQSVSRFHRKLADKHTLRVAKHQDLRDASNVEANRADVLVQRLAALLNDDVVDTTSVPAE